MGIRQSQLIKSRQILICHKHKYQERGGVWLSLITNTNVWREFKKINFKCYKIHISQRLHPGDPERRMKFCNWIWNRDNVPYFSKIIIWTDESTFTNCGVFNRNNEHIWSNNNPRNFRDVRRKFAFIWMYGLEFIMTKYSDRISSKGS